jgi:hypothetical protein
MTNQKYQKAYKHVSLTNYKRMHENITCTLAQCMYTCLYIKHADNICC